MKVVYWVSGLVIAAVLSIGALQFAASERVEVVELHTLDTKGQEQTTRLWIVDHAGTAYLRGDDGSGWVTRLKASSRIELTRDGERQTYTWQVRPDKVEIINELMRSKYTWGDQVINWLVGDRSQSNMFELTVAER